MTISIEYETDKKLDLDYDRIIREIILASLDYEKCGRGQRDSYR